MYVIVFFLNCICVSVLHHVVFQNIIRITLKVLFIFIKYIPIETTSKVKKNIECLNIFTFVLNRRKIQNKYEITKKIKLRLFILN